MTQHCKYCGHEVEEPCTAIGQIPKCPRSLGNPRTSSGGPTVLVKVGEEFGYAPLEDDSKNE